MTAKLLVVWEQNYQWDKLNIKFTILFFFLLALDILPNDSKALFRRCQGQEKLGRLESAFRDARTLIHIEPKVSADEKIASVVLKFKTQIAFLHL